MTQWMRSLGGGAAGALALTLLHELVRRRVRTAPRMDIVAMRGLTRLMPAPANARMSDDSLYRLALAGDLIANTIYYSAVPARTRSETWVRSIALGGVAGLGALLLPERLGLGTPPHSESHSNQVMTLLWYLAGAAAAAAATFATAPRDASHRFPASSR